MNYIKGKITHIIYHNEINGYTVGLIKIKETDIETTKNTYSFVGSFSNINEKNLYHIKGEVVVHDKYGKQFLTESYEVIKPEKKDELVDYLSSDVFPIGEKTAQKIVNAFKEDTLSVILNTPEKLLMIPRLSQKRIDKIHDTLVKYESYNNTVLELSKIGFNAKDAINIVNKYGDNTLNVVNNNIYKLIYDMDYSFKEIDLIAVNNLDIEISDERRVSSLITYLIWDIMSKNGDTYVLAHDLYNALILDISDYSYDDFEYILLKLNKKAVIVVNDDKVYLKNFYDAEEYIADRVLRLVNGVNSENKKTLKLLEKLEEINNFTYDVSQKNAIFKALRNNITIITGGPGTGKTTIVKAIIYLLKEGYGVSNEDIALLAPTGRASKRLSESTNLPSSTIHRYLGWDKDTGMFSVDESNPNNEKYIIIDESSMIDTLLMEALFKGTKKSSKYIFVGDYYQLPSVREGQVLKDFIDSGVIDIAPLDFLYRQNNNSYIALLASEVREKKIEDNFDLKKDDYNFIECPNDYIVNLITSVIDKALEKGYKESDIQVLAPMYKSLNGIDNLNKCLQEVFNPKDLSKNEIVLSEVIYREGDRVIQLVNDSEKNVYNGDLGYIRHINKTKSSSEIVISFDDNYVTYTPKDYINFTHGYAISIHKSQGGEFPMVIIPFSNSFKRMLYNKLVYTAITRAKKILLLVGDKSSFLYGVNNDNVNRKTTLKNMLCEGIKVNK